MLACIKHARVASWTKSCQKSERQRPIFYFFLSSLIQCANFYSKSTRDTTRHARDGWVVLFFAHLSFFIDNTWKAVSWCDLFLYLDRNCVRLRIPHRHRAASESFFTLVRLLFWSCCFYFVIHAVLLSKKKKSHINKTCVSRETLQHSQRQSERHDCTGS